MPLVNAILRQPHPQNAEIITANITMAFSQTQEDNDELQCQMSLRYRRTTWKGGLRPCPDLVLEGATWEGIWEVLGPEIHGDIAKSASNGGDIVWMLILEDSGDSATLSIRLHIRHDAKWRVRLYVHSIEPCRKTRII